MTVHGNRISLVNPTGEKKGWDFTAIEEDKAKRQQKSTDTRRPPTGEFGGGVKRSTTLDEDRVSKRPRVDSLTGRISDLSRSSTPVKLETYGDDFSQPVAKPKPKPKVKPTSKPTPGAFFLDDESDDESDQDENSSAKSLVNPLPQPEPKSWAPPPRPSRAGPSDDQQAALSRQMRETARAKKQNKTGQVSQANETIDPTLDDKRTDDGIKGKYNPTPKESTSKTLPSAATSSRATQPSHGVSIASKGTVQPNFNIQDRLISESKTMTGKNALSNSHQEFQTPAQRQKLSGSGELLAWGNGVEKTQKTAPQNQALDARSSLFIAKNDFQQSAPNQQTSSAQLKLRAENSSSSARIVAPQHSRQQALPNAQQKPAVNGTAPPAKHDDATPPHQKVAPLVQHKQAVNGGDAVDGKGNVPPPRQRDHLSQQASASVKEGLPSRMPFEIPQIPRQEQASLADPLEAKMKESQAAIEKEKQRQDRIALKKAEIEKRKKQEEEARRREEQAEANRHRDVQLKEAEQQRKEAEERLRRKRELEAQVEIEQQEKAEEEDRRRAAAAAAAAAVVTPTIDEKALEAQRRREEREKKQEELRAKWQQEKHEDEEVFGSPRKKDNFASSFLGTSGSKDKKHKTNPNPENTSSRERSNTPEAPNRKPHNRTALGDSEIVQSDGSVWHWREKENKVWTQVVVEFGKKFGRTISDTTVRKRHALVQKAIQDADVTEDLMKRLHEGDVVAKRQINVQVHGLEFCPDPKVTKEAPPKVKLALKTAQTTRVEDADTSKAVVEPSTTSPVTQPRPTTGGKTIDEKYFLYHLDAYHRSLQDDFDDQDRQLSKEDEGDFEKFVYHVYRRLLTPEKLEDYDEDPGSVDDIPAVLFDEDFDCDGEANVFAFKETMSARGEDPSWVQDSWILEKATMEHGLDFYLRRTKEHGALQVWVEREYIVTQERQVVNAPLLSRTIYHVKQCITTKTGGDGLFEASETTNTRETFVENTSYTYLTLANYAAVKAFVELTHPPRNTNVDIWTTEKTEMTASLSNRLVADDMFEGEKEFNGGKKIVKVWVEEGQVVGPRN